MKIIIDCQPLVHDCIHSSAFDFMLKCHQLLQQKTPETDWLFIFAKKNKFNKILVQIPLDKIAFKKMFANKIGWKLWYDHQLPSLIKKHKADLLITTGGISSSSPVAQIVWLAGIKSHFKKNKAYSHFFQNRIHKTASQPKIILALLQKSKQQIVDQNNLDEKRVIVVKGFTDEGCRPLSWAEKESAKTKYAAGKEYFLVVASEQPENLIDMLKAFSLFKKRQQSNMQIVFAGEGLKNDPNFVEKLETFKYRADVHLYSHLSDAELIRIISASYAFIHSFDEDETGTNILNAFKANVPVIISDKSKLDEIAADAALYADTKNHEALSSQLMLLYKDENLRSKLIEKGNSKWQQVDWSSSIKQLQDVIFNAANMHENNSM